MKYLKSYESQDMQIIADLSDKYDINKKLVEYIFYLGYNTVEKFDDYLNYKEICYSPFDLNGMAEAVHRIKQAISKNEKILIFGDYDVDGIGATAILTLYFRSIGVNVSYFLPSRYEDGYGLSIDTADKILNEFKPDLIITVDCGISCWQEVDYIKSKGVDIIVTDHHEIPDVLPNTIIIDPKLPNQSYPFKNLCGAGVALKLVYALSDLETCKRYYTICAISTISDLVDLVDENRYIVHYGLKNFEKDCPKGLKWLLQRQKISMPSASDIAFKLTPKLNAAGRLGDATLSLGLYLTEDESSIDRICTDLINLNLRRQQICNTIYEQTLNKINIRNKIIIIKDDAWESGVLGIVAAKLVGIYERPVIVLTLDPRTDRYVGSARGPSNYNIFEILSACSKYLATFGGHSMAGGLGIEKDQFDAFEEFIINYVNSLEIKPIQNYYDFKVEQDEIDEKFINDLTRLEPYGIANQKPKIMLGNCSRQVALMNRHNEHITLNLGRFNGVGFGLSKFFNLLQSKSDIDLIIEPYIETYRNNKTIKFYLQDVSCNTICSEEDYRNACIIKNKFFTDDDSVDISPPTGNVLYITYNDNVTSDEDWYINYAELSHRGNYTTLLVCPINYYGLEAFDCIAFLEQVPSGLIAYLKELYPDTRIIQGDNSVEFSLKNLQFEKKVFGLVFNLIKHIEISFKDDYTYYRNIIKNSVTYSQFVFCYKVLQQIGVIDVVEDASNFKIIVTGKSSDLMNSSVYRELLSLKEKL